MSESEPWCWWFEDDRAAARRGCHVAGVALHLLGELPRVEDEPGYCSEERLRELANAAVLVLPGHYGAALPDDSETFTARITAARLLVEDAAQGYTDDEPARILLGIAHDALIGLPELERQTAEAA